MRRIFKDSKDIVDDYILIEDDDFSHLKNSLRISEGASCEIVVDDRIYSTRLEIFEDHIKAQILNSSKIEKDSKRIRLFQCFLKGNSMDLVVEKATELGVDEIIPVVSHHTIARPNAKRYEKRKKRFEKIAEESSKQSKRKTIPRIGEMTFLNDLEVDDLICAYEKSDRSLKEVLQETKTDINILIGPEGGFSKEEMKTLRKKGVKEVSLGSRILKGETAPLFLLSVIQYEFNL